MRAKPTKFRETGNCPLNSAERETEGKRHIQTKTLKAIETVKLDSAWNLFSIKKCSERDKDIDRQTDRQY